MKRKQLLLLLTNLLKRPKLVKLLRKAASQSRKERVVREDAEEEEKTATDLTSLEVTVRAEEKDPQEKVGKDAEKDLRGRESSTDPSIKRRSLKETRLRGATVFPLHHLRRFVSSRKTRLLSWKTKVSQLSASLSPSPRTLKNLRSSMTASTARSSITTEDPKIPD